MNQTTQQQHLQYQTSTNLFDSNVILECLYITSSPPRFRSIHPRTVFCLWGWASRLRPRCCILVKLTKHCNWRPTGTDTWQTHYKHNAWFLPICPWYENMTSSTKPVVHNVGLHNAAREGPSHRQQTQKLVKFSRVVFELCKQTEWQTSRQTNKQTYSSQYFAPLPWGERSNYIGLTKWKYCGC